MKSIILFLSFISILVNQIYGQKSVNNNIRGVYSWSTGSPGRKVYKSENAYVNVPQETYTVNTLRIMRFSRAVETIKAYHGMGLDSKSVGSWKLEKDTLTIKFPNNTQIYRVLYNDERVLLTALDRNLTLMKEP